MNSGNPPRIPVVWTIAGTDPGGGAGIQGDLKTMQAFGVYGCSIITAVIAQNTEGVARIEHTPLDMLESQIDALREDLPPDMVKIGVLGRSSSVQYIARALNSIKAPIVYDPVLSSSSGASFLEPDTLESVLDSLLPLVSLLTPNIPEAETLSGTTIRSFSDTEKAARILIDMGAGSVVIKGGHRDGDHCRDYWTDGSDHAWLTSHRLASPNTHGTGCTFSSGAASAMSLGWPMLDALVIARAYISQGIRLAPGLGHGNGPLHHGPWPAHPEDLPWISETAENSGRTYHFPDLGKRPVGIYPIVESAEWIDRLAEAGVDTVQIRIKKKINREISAELREAITRSRKLGIRLFVNDHWEAAIEGGAYGVHLGQDDLDPIVVERIMNAGLRLGISTHSFAEMSRAWNYRPSYMAIGTVYRTASKTMNYEPLGIGTFRKLCALSPVPVVAIGGLKVENAGAVLEAGADGIAVISDISEAGDVRKRVSEWKNLFKEHPGLKKNNAPLSRTGVGYQDKNNGLVPR